MKGVVKIKKKEKLFCVIGKTLFAKSKLIYNDWPCGRMCVVGDILDQMVAEYMEEHPDRLFEIRTFLNMALAPAIKRANGEIPCVSDMKREELRTKAYRGCPDLGDDKPFSPDGGYILWGKDLCDEDWNKTREKKMQGLK